LDLAVSYPEKIYPQHANVRLIARLDVKMQHLIKGVHLEGWRKVGDPGERAALYYEQGADEILFMDVVASLYQRNNLGGIVRQVASEVFVPITVGGGIDNLDAVRELLAVGADKVAINTAATQRPELIQEISDTYGSQATVLSIEAKKQPDGGWEAMTDNGRNHTHRDVIEWAAEGASRGAGEILITSIDQDGTGRGFDLELIEAVSTAVNIPVIASGGCGNAQHVVDSVKHTGATAVAVAKAIHFHQCSLVDLRSALRDADIPVREVE